MDKMDELRAGIVLDLFRASNLLERVGRKLAAEAGLSTVQQWLLLGTISVEGELSLKDLREHTQVTKQNITGMVERLKQGGYIHTYEDSADRRITRVKLTDKGEKVLDIIEPMTNVSNEKSFGGFNREELENLSAYLRRLVNDLNRTQ
ncbi:MarR family winged helix-turn-helix transcriptional regulator [uncultured Paenibacillus sp.]|uniref:MarR family winged helix-turn-helix transcriptional regulator n=1 Tax=uncultured Paenibacillus sp. TaxID=227322 RepID=UPI0028D0EA58|nr:MarR family winged helix-turn-helix transcriptional regulator [uncultured Paenibacillus sp.]